MTIYTTFINPASGMALATSATVPFERLTALVRSGFRVFGSFTDSSRAAEEAASYGCHTMDVLDACGNVEEVHDLDHE